MKVTTVLFDMDGVLAEWHRKMAELLGQNWDDLPTGSYSLKDTFGVSAEDAKLLWHKKGVEGWVTIPPTYFFIPLKRLMFELVEQGVKVGICSDASFAPRAAEGKHAWLNAHGIPTDWPRIMTREKYILARPETLLVDDSPAQVSAFREHGGRALLVPRRWNCGSDLVGVDLFLTEEIKSHVFGSIRRRPAAA